MSLPDPAKIPFNKPIAPPPPGVQSNFDHPNMTKVHIMEATIAVTLGLAIFFLMARLYTRIVMVRNFGWDDAVAIFAAVLTVAFNAATLQEMKYGLARYSWDVRLKVFLQDWFLYYVEWNAISALLYTIAFGAVKISILLLQLRIFGATHKYTRWVIWAILALVASSTFSMVIVYLTICHPLKKLFIFNVPGTCGFDLVAPIARGQTCLQIITDLLITAAPLPVVMKLRMPAPQKIAVMLILGTGLFVTATSVVRLVILFPNHKISPTDLGEHFPLPYWSIWEVNLSLICASAPALKQFVEGNFPAVRSFATKFSSRLSSRRSGSTSVHKTSVASSGPMSWASRKNSRWGSASDRSGSQTKEAGGITQDTSFTMENRRIADGAYLELGPREDSPSGDHSDTFGTHTHVSAGDRDREMHSTSSRDPIVKH